MFETAKELVKTGKYLYRKEAKEFLLSLLSGHNHHIKNIGDKYKVTGNFFGYDYCLIVLSYGNVSNLESYDINFPYSEHKKIKPFNGKGVYSKKSLSEYIESVLIKEGRF